MSNLEHPFNIGDRVRVKEEKRGILSPFLNKLVYETLTVSELHYNYSYSDGGLLPTVRFKECNQLCWASSFEFEDQYQDGVDNWE